jgi:transposase, IS5 family
MQKPQDSNIKMAVSTEEEIFNSVLNEDHPFRKLNALINWDQVTRPLRRMYSKKGRRGIDVKKGFKALIVQYWEDYSDRQMEKALRENLAVKWFCGFGLTEKTPDHSYFGSLRSRIGASKLAKLFNDLNMEMEKQGLFGNIFAVIDASAIISKTALWEERDRAISDGHKKLNNKVVSKYAADKDAKWGVKGKNKVWFGYKRHASVDTRYGLIRKMAVTPANAPDFKSVKNVAENNMVYFLDKGYDYSEVDEELKKRQSESACIRKNNNKEKDFDRDKWRCKTRMPYEGVFSKLRKRARYKGKVKVFMQCIFESIVYNLKKTIVYSPKLNV